VQRVPESRGAGRLLHGGGQQVRPPSPPHRHQSRGGGLCQGTQLQQLLPPAACAFLSVFLPASLTKFPGRLWPTIWLSNVLLSACMPISLPEYLSTYQANNLAARLFFDMPVLLPA